MDCQALSPVIRGQPSFSNRTSSASRSGTCPARKVLPRIGPPAIASVVVETLAHSYGRVVFLPIWTSSALALSDACSRSTFLPFA